MAAVPVKTGLPDNLHLDGSYTIRFTAVDASTGGVLATVNISDASILADSLGSGTLTSGPFMLVPGPENG